MDKRWLSHVERASCDGQGGGWHGFENERIVEPASARSARIGAAGAAAAQ